MAVAPALGAAILSLTQDGVPILRPAPDMAVMAGDVRQAACFPLLPFANRIAGGRFTFAGRSHRLTPNLPGHPHPVHGNGWQRPWEVRDHGPAHLSLRLVHRPAGGGDWPFAFTADIDYQLLPSGLSMAMRLINDDVQVAPAGLGLHPYFMRRPGTHLHFAARSVARMADGLPIGTVIPPEPDFRNGRPLDGLVVDTDYQGWNGGALIREAGSAHGVELKADPLFGTLRLYLPATGDFFALEPVSHGADALNQPVSSPMTKLMPGDQIAGRVGIGIVRL